MRWKSSIREVMVALALAGLTGAVFAGGALAEPASVGQVVALSGAVQAAAPGQEPRTLSCNDSVYEGEVLSTSEGARVGILSSEIYAQLDTGARLALGSSEGVPAFRLVSGAARIVDTRVDTDALAFQIATPHASASGLGGDVEIWLVERPGESHSRICSRGAPVRVSGAEQPLGEEGESATATAEGVSPAGSRCSSQPAPQPGWRSGSREPDREHPPAPDRRRRPPPRSFPSPHPNRSSPNRAAATHGGAMRPRWWPTVRAPDWRTPATAGRTCRLSPRPAR